MNVEIVKAVSGPIATVLAAIATAALPILFARLRKAKTQIDTLNFLVAHLLTRPEKDHLRRINAPEPFMVDTRDNFARFRDEISHLLNLGFITYHVDKSGLDMFRDGEPYERCVDSHCETTKLGRTYLDLLAAVASQETPAGG
jgi:hypothetical protein